MSDAIRIVLPLPPSLNNAYSNIPGRGRVASKAHKQWKRDAGWRLKAQRPGCVGSPYRLAIYLPQNMRGDVDGRIKLASDLLVEHGVTPDDRFAASMSAERCELIATGECLIVVEGVTK